MRAPLAYIIRVIIKVQTHCDYSRYVTLDNKILPVEYEIDNRTVYDIIRSAKMRIYIYVKPNKFKGWQRGILCHPLQVARPKSCEFTVSDPEAALQILTYDGEKKSWNWEK